VETLDKDDYFKVGMELLAEGGHAYVTVANLCERLDVTKGSFYHHFASGPEFLRELLVFWEAGYEPSYGQLGRITDPIERVEFVKHMALELSYKAEAAIRALARTDDFAREIQRRVTDFRTEVLTQTLADAGVPGPRARVLADVGMTLLVGLQHSEQPDDRRHAALVFDEYQRWIEASSSGP
jgi:AcrR family transcriptional regulator